MSSELITVPIGDCKKIVLKITPIGSDPIIPGNYKATITDTILGISIGRVSGSEAFELCEGSYKVEWCDSKCVVITVLERTIRGLSITAVDYDYEYVCDKDSKFYSLYTFETINGVRNDTPIITPTTISCHHDHNSFDEETYCNSDTGTNWIRTVSFDEDGVKSVLSDTDTNIPCDITNDDIRPTSPTCLVGDNGNFFGYALTDELGAFKNWVTLSGNTPTNPLSVTCLNKSTKVTDICVEIPEQESESITNSNLPVSILPTSNDKQLLTQFIYDGVTYPVDPSVVLKQLGDFDGDLSPFIIAFRAAFEEATGLTLASLNEWGTSFKPLAHTGEVFDLTPSGLTSIDGSVWDGINHWAVSFSTDTVAKFDVNWVYTGFSFPTSGEDSTMGAIAFDGTNLRLSGTQTDKIYEYDRVTGLTVGTPLVIGAGASVHGLTVLDNLLYTLDLGLDLITRRTLSGVVDPLWSISVIDEIGTNAPVDLTNDGTNLYVSGIGVGEVFQYSTLTEDYTGVAVDYSNEFLNISDTPTVSFMGSILYIIASQNKTVYEYQSDTLINIPDTGTADLSLLTGITLITEDILGATVVTKTDAVGTLASSTFDTIAIGFNRTQAKLLSCIENCAVVSTNLYDESMVELDEAYIISECSLNEVHILLDAGTSTFPFTVPKGTDSYSIVVQQGEAKIDGILYKEPDGIEADKGSGRYQAHVISEPIVGTRIIVRYSK